MIKNGYILKAFSWFFIWIMLISILPQNAYALTGGPGAPEFSSFEPVSTNNMVNEFTGDFTYNLPLLEIPGPEGSGYPISLSYHSGTSPEEEASWVGYGWTLNPGAINRAKRGYADDHNGIEVITHNDTPTNWTATLGGDVGGLEIFGSDAVTLGLNASLRYNNYKGFGYVAGAGFHVKGVGSLGYSVNDGQGSFSYSVNPSINLSKDKKEQSESESEDNEQHDETLEKKDQKRKLKFTGGSSSNFSSVTLGSSYGAISRNYSVSSTTVSSYTGTSVNISGSFEPMPTGAPFSTQFGIKGSYSQQNSVDKDTVNSYGYLYSDQAYTDPKAGMDYYSEKESPYNKRDQSLAVPISNADNYSMVGEGLGGSFRARSKVPGHFKPTKKESNTGITNIAVEFQVGTNIGVGGDIGVGSHNLKVDKWIPSNYKFSTLANDQNNDENFSFRFKNDLGGNFLFEDDKAKRASLSGDLPSTNNFDHTADFSNYNETQTKGRTGKSSYLGYTLNGDMVDSNGDPTYKSFTKNNYINSLLDRKSPALSNQIGEFTTTNEDGMTYTFGLPVYAKDEVNMQYGFKNVPASDIVDGYKLYANSNDAGNIRSKVGQETAAPYATTYLLTSIISPDYIDRTFDGPTEDDFGSWTRFSYKRHHPAIGTDPDDWYNWRIPYNGFLYNKNTISNARDDLASFSSGEKQIYYLDTIETKTHFAVFERSERLDGIEAAINDDAGKDSLRAGSFKLEKLDRIKLFAKSNNTTAARLLQTVTFKYDLNNQDYELMKGLPNSVGTGKGKLTLKAIYTEYEGVNSAKISPYIFKYEYPEITYPEPYGELDSLHSGVNQNPDYHPNNLDAWGYYQPNGKMRYDSMRTWIDQTPPEFDPAAWQLKQIRLPSGGEIHVQYEQKEYLYVQDRRAMAMTSLTAGDADRDTFYLDVENDLGVSDLYAQADIIQKEIIDKEEKIYFKFLYSLIGTNPQLDNCQSEYITGYADVANVGVDPDGLFISLKNGSHSLPVHVCRDYVKVERGGNIPPVGSCDPSTDGMDGTLGAEDVAMQLLGFMGSTFSGNAINCKEINHELSYLRIPLLKPKKGGGIRVKRLLMYDQSLGGEKVLFGNEYHYEIEDPITKEISSSGVATNEPPTIREECALTVNLQKRTDQGWFEKAIAGKDKDNFEGPIGESILPGASIGYRRVYKTNIHRGRTNPGFTVNDYYTTYDYPFDKRYAFLGNEKAFGQTEIKELKKEWLNIPAGLFTYKKSNLWLSQGYHFVQTDFNGKPKQSATYTGDYVNMYDPNLVALTSSQEYEYFQPGEKIPISHGVDMADISMESVGKEMELVFEGRVTEDINDDYNVEGDGSLGFFGIVVFPFITAIPSASYNESKLHTHVSTKITSYPTITKSVKSFQDGVYSTVENLAFSPDNGRPLLTRSYDGYRGLQQSQDHHGTYLSYAFAASDEYSSLGQRTYNEGRVLNLSPSNYSLFSAGDLLEYNNQLAFVESVDASQINLSYVNGASGFDGNEVTIIRSGNANRLNENTGNLVVYGDSITTDYITVPDLNLTERQKVVDALNDLLSSPVSTQMVVNIGNLEINFNSQDSCSNNQNQSTFCYECGNLVVGIEHVPDPNGYIFESIITLSCSDISCCFSIPRRFKPINGLQLNLGDEFSLDAISGSIQFFSSTFEERYNITNCPFCDGTRQAPVIAGVIDASASTYSDDWEMDMTSAAEFNISSGLSPFEYGARGKWKTDASYVYREDIFHGNDNPLITPDDDNNRIYDDAGVYKQFMLFDWQEPSHNFSDKWLRVNKTNLYSPHGQALEDEDIRGVKSAAKFGYHENLPYLVAQNSPYHSASFESFEVNYGTSVNATIEDGVTVDSVSQGHIEEGAHSGSKSLLLKVVNLPGNPYTYSSVYESSQLMITKEIKAQGLNSKVWVKTRKEEPSLSFGGMYLDIVNSSISNIDFERIARTGEWTLYECKIMPSAFSSIAENTIVTPSIRFETVSPQSTSNPPWGEIWIDDVRFQPMESQMTCYVYDTKTYRLLTSFDDQHFGLFYQYNAEGKLIRKVIETERGFKTVQETQYHTPEITKW